MIAETVKKRILLLLVIFFSLTAINCHGIEVEFAYTYLESEPPRWTPDSSEIVVAAKGNLYRVSADGSTLAVIYEKEGGSRGAHSPSLSPSGDRVVYSREVRGDRKATSIGYKLFISNLDGSGVVQVTNNRAHDLAPVWSPDGSKIVYTGFDPASGPESILTISLDGSNVTDIAPGLTTPYMTLPVWSPDGRYIAFLGHQKTEPDISPYTLYTVKSDGTELTKITDTAISPPAWSPDSTSLAFVVFKGRDTPGNFRRLVNVVKRDGTGMTEAFVGAPGEYFIQGYPHEPAWSPDGSEILFGGYSIAYFNIEKAEVRHYRLSSPGSAKPVRFSTPTWSPDRSRLAAVIELEVSHSRESQLSHLISMRPDGTDKRLVLGWDPETGDAVPGRGKPWSPQSGFSWQWVDIPAHPCPEASGCEQSNVSSMQLFHETPTGAGFDYERPVPTVEDLMERGFAGGGASPTHIAIKGVADSGTVRCDWRGVARTLAQREQAIRYWLNLEDDDDLPSPAEVESRFNSYIDTTATQFRVVFQASFEPLAEGGMTDEYQFLTCYVDYDVSEYLLGAGANRVIIAYDNRTGEATLSYDLYKTAHESGTYGEQELMTRADYQSVLDQTVQDAETALAETLDSRSAIVFLSPMGAHHAIAVESWQAVGQWDLQVNDQAELIAVRYGVNENHEEYSQTLANLKSRVTSAAASDDFADDRIENVSGLTQYYQDIGAYGDITPGDDDTTKFTPAKPLPVQVCRDATSVGTTTSLSLIRDCSALLDLKDTLAGSASLNWSKDTAIANWSGVTVSGTPQRVTVLNLPSSSLTGSIPAETGALKSLTTLNLSSNSLTGQIPASLGRLPDLTTLRLSGNSLSGCVPVALRDVATNDLATLSISYCDMLTAPPAPSGLSLSVADGTFTISWDEVSGVTIPGHPRSSETRRGVIRLSH